MGNSFAHLPDFHGDQRDHLRAIENFYGLIKPGGILVIDHRNYDGILDQGQAPKNNIYYNVTLKNKLETTSTGHSLWLFISVCVLLAKNV